MGDVASFFAGPANKPTQPCSADFERELMEHFGRFESRIYSNRNSHSITCNSTRLFRPIRVIAAGLATRREREALHEDWSTNVFLMQQVAGQTRLIHGDRNCLLKPSDLVLLDAHEACEYHTPRYSEVMLFPFARDFIGPTTALTDMCGTRIDGRAGVGRVLSSVLSSIQPSSASIAEADKLAISDVVRTLLTTVVAKGAQTERTLARPQLDAIDRFITAELANPQLDTSMMAAEFNLSRRQLYQLFADAGATPGAWIWQRRFDEARRRLAAPQWATDTVTDIAFGCGFSCLAHFSRSYRSRFGVSPSEDRGQAS